MRNGTLTCALYLLGATLILIGLHGLVVLIQPLVTRTLIGTL